MISFPRYIAGCAELAIVAAALGFAAYSLRRRLVAGWTGAPARLAEIVLALSILVLVDEVLGTVGLFKPGFVIPALIVVGIATGLVARRGVAEGEGLPPIIQPPWWAVAAALAACAFVVALWSLDTQRNLDRGMYGFDTLWYHMPFAASYVQSGSITGLHFTDPAYLNWFYPANSELIHATGILFFDRDILSPLMNVGWLGLTLLAAWCIGRPYGAGPLAVIGVAVLMGAHSMETGQPGDAKNDIVGIALLMSSVALLVNADPRRAIPWRAGALVVAGLAAGLAAGTKLDLLAAVAILTVGVIVVAAAGSRRAATFAFGAPMLLTGGFWYLRNLVAAGNPLPWVKHLGPVSLPHPTRLIEGREPFTVAHYLFKTSTYEAQEGGSIFGKYFLHGLHQGFAKGWPLFLGLALGGMVIALVQGATRATRMLGAFALLAVVAYLFTPLGASGPEGMPVGFFLNLRYLVPALAIGLALLPLFLPVNRGPALAGAIAVYAALAIVSDKPRAIQNSLYTRGALVFAFVLVLLPFVLYMLGRRGGQARALPALALVVLALATVAVGWPESRTYLRNRYTLTPYESFHLDRPYQWARDQRAQRIGLAGTTIAYFQYGLYGTDSSNRVTYIGERTAHGGLHPITSCDAWRRAVNDGRYAYVVTSPFLNQNVATEPIPSPEKTWLRTDPGARLVLRDAYNSVFEIQRPLDPAGCAKLGARAQITVESLKPPA